MREGHDKSRTTPRETHQLLDPHLIRPPLALRARLRELQNRHPAIGTQSRDPEGRGGPALELRDGRRAGDAPLLRPGEEVEVAEVEGGAAREFGEGVFGEEEAGEVGLEGEGEREEEEGE